MARQSKLVSPSLVSEMKAELQSLAETEPGSKDLSEVVTELMPLIRGCRDRGHSWKRIAESLGKFHTDLTLSRLKRLAFELDPSLKGNKTAKESLIPNLNHAESVDNNWPSDDSSDHESLENNWPLDNTVEDEPHDVVKKKVLNVLENR